MEPTAFEERTSEMATAARTVVPIAEERVGRAAVIGGLIGIVVVTLAVWVLGVVSGLEALPALGLGMFVGSWGGFGFGAMLAASVAGNNVE
jgi:hypothetical protein